MRYNKKLEAGGKIIKELVAQYNKIVAAINSARRDALPRADVTFEQILAAEFPWLAEPRDGNIFAPFRVLGSFLPLRSLCGGFRLL